MEIYFKVGQAGYDLIHGKGKVISTNDSIVYPIRVRFEKSDQKYCDDGRFSISDHSPSLFQVAPIVTPNVPIVEFTKGELVWVRNLRDESNWFAEFFSHLDDNKYLCFEGQQQDGFVYAWSEIRKFNDNPLLTA